MDNAPQNGVNNNNNNNNNDNDNVPLLKQIRNFVRDPIDMTVALLTNCGPVTKFFGNHAAFLRSQGTWIQPMTHPSPTQQARWSGGAFAKRTRAIARDFGFYPIMASRG